MLNIINPAVGLGIAFRCALVILGSNNPLEVDFTSRMAELSGSLPSSLALPSYKKIMFSEKQASVKCRYDRGIIKSGMQHHGCFDKEQPLAANVDKILFIKKRF